MSVASLAEKLWPFTLSISEKRSGTRVSFGGQVRCRFFGDKKREFQEAKAIDLAHGGIRLLTPLEVKAGDHLELKVYIGKIKRTVKFTGKVIWSKPLKGGTFATESGVRFVDLKDPSHIGFLADEICLLAKESWSRTGCRPAETLEELKAAYRLVYKEFLKRGYCAPNVSEMHYHFFCTLPESRTFFLEEKGKLLGTLSLIVDSPCGLPLEAVFHDELNALRKPERKLAEVGLLAMDESAFGEKRFLLTNFQKLASTFKLFKIMFDCARFSGVTDLIIGIHPKHEALYRYLMFETIGPVRSYPGVCGKPVLQMRLRMESAIQGASLGKIAPRYFVERATFPNVLKKHYPWTNQAVRELLVDTQSLWFKMSPVQQTYLKNCYPGLSGME